MRRLLLEPGLAAMIFFAANTVYGVANSRAGEEFFAPPVEVRTETGLPETGPSSAPRREPREALDQGCIDAEAGSRAASTSSLVRGSVFPDTLALFVEPE